MFEMDKFEVKKDMKHALAASLRAEGQLKLFTETWLRLISFFNFYALLHADYRALKEQFEQNKRMAALVHLYFAVHHEKNLQNGSSFAIRQLNNSKK